MNELESILNYLETTSLEPHDDYVSEFSYKDQKTLWKYIKELQQENQELKKQLEYLRSGEYINQLKFERNMLEDVVNKGEVSKEDKEFIDMTHRNTELLEQQKEFIEWLEQKVKKYTPNLRVSELDEFGYRVAQYINAEVYEIPPEDVVKEVLSKYKEIIGVEM